MKQNIDYRCCKCASNNGDTSTSLMLNKAQFRYCTITMNPYDKRYEFRKLKSMNSFQLSFHIPDNSWLRCDICLNFEYTSVWYRQTTYYIKQTPPPRTHAHNTHINTLTPWSVLFNLSENEFLNIFSRQKFFFYKWLCHDIFWRTYVL